MTRPTRLLLLIGLLSTLTAEAWAINTDVLREVVVIVRPKHRQESKELLFGLAKHFKESNQELAQHFAVHGQDSSHGTGWVFKSPRSGQLYVVTNRHVVGAAGRVELIKEVLDDRMEPHRTTISDASIVYVDDQADLAILRANLGPHQQALPVRRQRPSGGTTVWAAGFPGLGGTELWQATQGHITNPAGPMIGGRFRVLQHSAAIDGGNSGGPLLVQTDGGGFEVVGVNTWNAARRSNTAFAISIDELIEVIETAEVAARNQDDPAALKRQLEQRANQLAGELTSGRTQLDSVEGFVSYLYVARWGWPSISALLSPESNLSETERDQLASAMEDPLVGMRTAAAYVFIALAKRKSESPKVRFVSVNPNDEGKIGREQEIRTTFSMDDDDVEVTWTYEHGHWRISDDNFKDLIGAQGQADPEVAAVPKSEHEEAIDTPSGDANSKDLRRKTSGVVFVPKLGFLMSGGFSGEGNIGCTGAAAGAVGCGPFDVESTDLVGGFVFGADLLFHAGKSFRLGPGIAYHPSVTDELDGTEYENGSELDANFALEFVIDTSPAFALLLRGYGGLGVLFPDGDLLDALEAQESACMSATCEYDVGPFAGFNWGVGAGFLFPFTSSALRAELMYSSFAFTIESSEAVAFPTAEVTSTLDMNIDRTMVLVGLDL